jgi:hypothetical protein
MAEVKNLFIKSKMNKDLDDRLLPSGEYRDAQNIMISRSEGADVGALENILGNYKLNNTIINPDDEYPHLSIIGAYIDEVNNRIFTFLTNFTDSSSQDELDFTLDPAAGFMVGEGAQCMVCCYLQNSDEYIILVKGRFLNFDKNSPVLGVDLLENLLFWTDNRNQPRKINVDRALEFPATGPNPYYTEEHQVSVAKYYPYNAANLWYNDTVLATEQCGMQDKSTEYYPQNIEQPTPGYDNPTYDATFAGDPNYLEDKFVRFSYRFKFDDNEYSLMAPFTQVAFIPKQDGFFMAKVDSLGGLEYTNETNTYRSSVLEFMENKVDFVKLVIDLPCQQDEIRELFKIEAIDILYKESDSISVKVVDTIEFPNKNYQSTDTFLEYDYNSTKPIKVLPEIQTVRVSDRIPLRALSQAITGNRVMYGNYVNRQPYPTHLDFKVGISEKTVTSSGASLPTVTRIEYPNHTLKQNRDYEVGIVLSDKFGRQSPVITSVVTDESEIVGGVEFGDSTIYYPYYNEPGSAINPQVDILDWCGDSLKILFKQAVELGGVGDGALYSETNPLGWYSYKIVVKQKEQDYYNVFLPGMLLGYPFYNTDQILNATTADFVGDTSHIVLINDNINKVPRDLSEVGPTQQVFGSRTRLSGRVQNVGPPLGSGSPIPAIDQTHNIQYYPSITSDQVVEIGTMEDLDFGPNKVYNLTTPSSFIDPNGATGLVAADPQDATGGNWIYVKEYIPTLVDNQQIEPIAIDTASLGNQLCYIINMGENPDFIDTVVSAQPAQPTITAQSGYKYFCKGRFQIVDGDGNFLAGAEEVVAGEVLRITNPIFYSSSANPLIAQLNTANPIGASTLSTMQVIPEFSVYETNPVESSLEIYWETTTSGLISDLNDAIATGAEAVAVEDWDYKQLESYNPGDEVINNTNGFTFIDALSVVVPANVLLTSVTSTDPNGIPVNRTAEFTLVAGGVPNYYNIETTSLFYFGEEAAIDQTEVYTFNFLVTPIAPGVNTTQLSKTGALSNVAPYLNTADFVGEASSTVGVIDANPAFPDTPNGANINDPRKDLGLIFEIVTQVDLTTLLPVNYFFLTSPGGPNPLTRNVVANGNALPGTYSVIYRLTDANGEGISVDQTRTIIINEPSLLGNLIDNPTGTITSKLWRGGMYYWGASLTSSIHDTNGQVPSGSASNSPIQYQTQVPGYESYIPSFPGNDQIVTSTVDTYDFYHAPSTTTYTGLQNQYYPITPQTSGWGDNIDNNVGASATYSIPGGNNSWKWGKDYEEDFYSVQMESFVIPYSVKPGVQRGTAMLTLSMNAVGLFKKNNIFQNFAIQHRADENSPWTDAVDLNGQTFRGMIWDYAGSYDQYDGQTAVFWNGVPRVHEELGVRYTNSNVISGANWPNTNKPDTGMYADAYVGVSFLSFDPTWAVKSHRFNLDSTEAAQNNRLYGTMALRNYSEDDVGFGTCTATRTFVFDAVGDYRLVADNLRPGIQKFNSYFPETGANSGASPARRGIEEYETFVGTGYSVGDFYDPIGDLWYAYILSPTGSSTLVGAMSSAGQKSDTTWANDNFSGILVFARERCFRYVTQFYTRTGTPGNYTFSLYGGTALGSYYAFTEPYGAVADAGQPTGNDYAYGPWRTPGGASGSGCKPIWGFKANDTGGRALGYEGIPRPFCFRDVNDINSATALPWYPSQEYIYNV